jgi:hypothetical protein
VTNSRLRKRHLKRRTGPKVIVEAAREHGSSELIEELQVAHAFVQSGKQGYSLLKPRRSLMGPYLNREVFIGTRVAVTLTAGAEASDELVSR